MTRFLRHAIDLVLGLAALLVLWRIGPKVADQARAVISGATQLEVIWVGVTGVGVLVALLLILASLSSLCHRVGRLGRGLYALVGALLVAGIAVSVLLDRRTTGHVFWNAYLTFLAAYFLFALPVILGGRGYGGLIAGWWRSRTAGATRGERGG